MNQLRQRRLSPFQVRINRYRRYTLQDVTPFFYKTHRRSGQLLLREYSHLLLKSSMLKNGTKKGGRCHLRNKRRRGREYVEGGDALEAGESEREPCPPKNFCCDGCDARGKLRAPEGRRVSSGSLSRVRDEDEGGTTKNSVSQHGESLIFYLAAPLQNICLHLRPPWLKEFGFDGPRPCIPHQLNVVGPQKWFDNNSASSATAFISFETKS